MNIKKHIPNIITLINLFCGCVALVFISNLQFDYAFYAVCLGIFFDFFDGFFARKFNVSGPLGVQLDSLADMVTSGVAPAFAMYKMMINDAAFGSQSLMPYCAFIIALGACYRLANFNIDTRQSDSFIGLPTPANSLFFMSLPVINDCFLDDNFSKIVYNNWLMIGLCVLSAFIMNAEIPLFSLKIKGSNFKKYKLQFFFLLISIILLVVFQIVAVPLIIILYIILSVLNNIFISKK